MQQAATLCLLALPDQHLDSTSMLDPVIKASRDTNLSEIGRNLLDTIRCEMKYFFF